MGVYFGLGCLNGIHWITSRGNSRNFKIFDMKINVWRYAQTPNDGVISAVHIDHKFECYFMENDGKELIPDGVYAMGFRKEGGMHKGYTAKFGDAHKGMLEVKNVTNRDYILIHIGNYPKDSKGCSLVGNGPLVHKGMIQNSTDTYKLFYPKVAAALMQGEQVKIEYKTLYV